MFSFRSKLVIPSIRQVSSSLNLIRHKTLVPGNSSKHVSHGNAVNCDAEVKNNYFEEIRIPVPWGHVAGKAWGNKNGLPVLGIHGWLDNAGSFDKIAPLLHESMYFVAIELPGHGLSSHLPAGISYNFVEYLLTLRRILQYFKWEKYSIIGHSMGAGLGALLAGLYSNEVERLVLLDLMKLVTLPMDDDYPKYFGESFDAFLQLEHKSKSEDTPTYSYKDAVSRLVRGSKNALTEESAKILMVRGAHQIDNDDRWQYNRDVLVNHFRVLRFTHETIFNILGQIKCPTLFLAAQNGLVMEAKSVTDPVLAVYQKNPRFKKVETPGNHFFHLNEPAVPADEINKFFQQET